MGGITNKTVHLSFAVDWSKEVNPLLIDVDSQSQIVMQSMGKEIIEEDLGGFYIITRDGSKITANSITHKHKIRLDKFGKTVFRNETWSALSVFREKLEEQRIITRK